MQTDSYSYLEYVLQFFVGSVVAFTSSQYAGIKIFQNYIVYWMYGTSSSHAIKGTCDKM